MKIFIFYFFALLIVFSSYAQDENYTDLTTKFGLKAGINNTSVKTVDADSDFVQNNTGFYIGAFLKIPTSDTFSIQPELNYISGEYTANDKISLLHVPVLLRLEVGNGFAGYIGPEAILLLDLDDPNKDEFNTFMLGFTFGAAYNINKHLGIEVRPVFGITRFYDDGLDSFRRYNTLQFGVFYTF